MGGTHENIRGGTADRVKPQEGRGGETQSLGGAKQDKGKLAGWRQARAPCEGCRFLFEQAVRSSAQ